MSVNPYETSQATNQQESRLGRLQKNRKLSAFILIGSLITGFSFAKLSTLWINKLPQSAEGEFIFSAHSKQTIFMIGGIMALIIVSIVISALITLVTTIRIGFLKKDKS